MMAFEIWISCNRQWKIAFHDKRAESEGKKHYFGDPVDYLWILELGPVTIYRRFV
jgi:hypothetical protein